MTLFLLSKNTSSEVLALQLYHDRAGLSPRAQTGPSTPSIPAALPPTERSGLDTSLYCFCNVPTQSRYRPKTRPV
jgi:hypothetical protein